MLVRFAMLVGISALAVGLAPTRAAEDVPENVPLAEKLAQSPMSLAKAVAVVEEADKGRVTSAVTNLAEDKLSFTVYFMTEGKLMAIPVSESGELGEPREVPEKEEKQVHHHEAAKIAKVFEDNKITVSKAIQAAEDHEKGVAVNTSIYWHGRISRLFVFVVKNGKTEKVAIDTKTGKVFIPLYG